MKIALLSDVHLEFSPMTVKNETGADVLILAGDICVADDFYSPKDKSHMHWSMEFGTLSGRELSAAKYREFFDSASKEYDNIIYVAGNHEFYHGKWSQSLQILRDECSEYKNIHFLEDDSIFVGDVMFIGGTLWTDMNKSDPMSLNAAQNIMSDFLVIKNDDLGCTNLRPMATVERHKQTMSYFERVISGAPDTKSVVVGHHAPTTESISEQYRGQHLLNGAYASDLSEFILDHPQIKAWVHGHMHSRSDYMVGTTRIMANPRGYPGQENGFDVNFTFEV